MNLTVLAEQAIHAATTAGQYIAQTRPTRIQHKVGGENLASQVLTEVDEESQRIILEKLEPTLSEYNLALLTEERADNGSRLNNDHFWCIDPIDGTLPFIEDQPGYAVSIALVARTGTPLIGVVYDPITHTLYHAVKGQGAFRNSIPWEQPTPKSTLQIFTDRSMLNQPRFTHAAHQLKASISATGGAVMNAIWCLEHPPACYFKFPKTTEGGGCLWDYAATACIYTELGAIATDIHGAPLDLNRPDSTFMNHRGILFATDPETAQQVMHQNLC